MNHPIKIVDYDPTWPQRYEAEKARILAVIGSDLLAIEHVGRTAVPGLGAKPIIDIMVAISRLMDVGQYVEPLQRLGYCYLPEYEVLIPERRFFRKFLGGEATHHLHIVQSTSRFWQHHLLFCDFLRDHPEVAREYEALKRRLAVQYGADRGGYTDAKTSFIETVLARAGASLNGTGRSPI